MNALPHHLSEAVTAERKLPGSDFGMGLELEVLAMEKLKGVADATFIRPPDLRPLMLESVEHPEGTLVLKQARSTGPSYEDGRVMSEVPDLHIVATGETQEELTRDAADLAARLRSMVEEARL